MPEFSESRSWRIVDSDEPGWAFMIFEKSSEAPGVRDLTEDESSSYLDSVISVSGSERERDQLELMDGCEGPSRSREGLLPF